MQAESAVFVMLDLDNTLADRARAVEQWASEFVAEQALDSGRVDWLLTIDNDGYASRIDVFRRIVEELSVDGPPEKLLAEYQQRIVSLTEPVPGALSCLAELRADGHVLAIVTNGSAKQQNAKIVHLELEPLVDAVIVSEMVGIKKPDPAIFEAAAQAAGAELADAWMVGDSAHHDVGGAQALGVHTAWVSRGRSWDQTRPPPHLIVDDLAALPRLLAR